MAWQPLSAVTVIPVGQLDKIGSTSSIRLIRCTQDSASPSDTRVATQVLSITVSPVHGPLDTTASVNVISTGQSAVPEDVAMPVTEGSSELPGHPVNTGGQLSMTSSVQHPPSTITKKLHVVILPQLSTAVYVTVCCPNSKTPLLDPKLLEKLAMAQLSDAEGGVQDTVAKQFGSADTLMSLGQLLMIGA